jgi:hypothetical protein
MRVGNEPSRVPPSRGIEDGSQDHPPPSSDRIEDRRRRKKACIHTAALDGSQPFRGDQYVCTKHGIVDGFNQMTYIEEDGTYVRACVHACGEGVAPGGLAPHLGAKSNGACMRVERG